MNSIATWAGLILGAVNVRSVAQDSRAHESERVSATPLVTDRPDFTESTQVVPPGRVQFEMGYTFVHDREDGRRTGANTAPELLFRVGIHERFELRLGWEGYVWDHVLERERADDGQVRSVSVSTQGALDASIGGKFRLVDASGWQPDMSLIGAVSLPTAASGFGSGDVDPELVLLLTWPLSERFALSSNVGLTYPTDEDHRVLQGLASLSLGITLSDRWGAYVEYFGIYPGAEGEDCAHTLNGGFTFLVTPDFQLDARLGAGLNEQADDFFVGAGLAWRW